MRHLLHKKKTIHRPILKLAGLVPAMLLSLSFSNEFNGAHLKIDSHSLAIPSGFQATPKKKCSPSNAPLLPKGIEKSEMIRTQMRLALKRFRMGQSTPADVIRDLQNLGLEESVAKLTFRRFLMFDKNEEVTDPRVHIPFEDRVKILEKRRHFLSKAGKAYLRKLQRAIQENKPGQIKILKIKFPTIDNPHLEYFKPLSVDDATAAKIFDDLAALRIVRGCSHACRHCFFNPGHKVHMLPFYRIMGLLEAAKRADAEKKDNPRMALHWDSEILDYYDPLYGADAGDVAVKLLEYFPNLRISITTRGWYLGDQIAPRAAKKIVGLIEKNRDRLSDYHYVLTHLIGSRGGVTPKEINDLAEGIKRSIRDPAEVCALLEETLEDKIPWNKERFLSELERERDPFYNIRISVDLYDIKGDPVRYLCRILEIIDAFSSQKTVELCVVHDNSNREKTQRLVDLIRLLTLNKNLALWGNRREDWNIRFTVTKLGRGVKIPTTNLYDVGDCATGIHILPDGTVKMHVREKMAREEDVPEEVVERQDSMARRRFAKRDPTMDSYKSRRQYRYFVDKGISLWKPDEAMLAILPENNRKFLT